MNKSRASRDGKKRKDSHVLHTKYYLIFVMGSALADYSFYGIFQNYISKLYFESSLPSTMTNQHLKLVVLVWLVVESTLWILFYMLLRILIEKRRSTFNEAEYFTILPVVLFTQIVLLPEYSTDSQ